MSLSFRSVRVNPTFTNIATQFDLQKGCKHCRLRHIGGANDIQVSFGAWAGLSTPVHTVLSPTGGIYPQQVEMDWDDGFDNVYANTAGGTIEITVWK
jgi:hypothetical protein